MTSEEQELARRKIYQAMIEQGMTPDPQQVVSGRVVPYSPIQGLSKLAQAYLGRHGLDKMDQAAIERQGLERGAISDYLKTSQGVPETDYKLSPEQQFDNEQIPGLKNAGIEANPNKAMQDYAANPNARQSILDSLIAKQMGIGKSQASDYYTYTVNADGSFTKLDSRGITPPTIVSAAQAKTDPNFNESIPAKPITSAPGKAAVAEAVIPAAVTEAGSVRGAQNQSDLEFKPKIASAEVTAKHEAEKLIDKPKAQMILEEAYANNKNVKNNIAKAINQATSWSTGLLSQPLDMIGSTDARNLRGTLATIKSSIGLEALQNLRSAGGTLGQVTEAEHRLLQDKWAALDQAQSKEELIARLNDLNEQVAASWDRVNLAYEKQYGEKYITESSKKDNTKDSSSFMDQLDKELGLK